MADKRPIIASGLQDDQAQREGLQQDGLQRDGMAGKHAAIPGNASPMPDDFTASHHLGPDTFDEVTQDETEESPAADFIPPPELDQQSIAGSSKIDPFQYDSLKAQEAFDAAGVAANEGSEEEAIHHYIRAAKIAETAREWHLAAVACRRVGDFLLDPNPPTDIERAFRMYRRAVAAYENCGLFAEARELAYRQTYIKMQRGEELNLPLAHRLVLWLEWATAGFGYRPLRVIATNAVIILFYSLIYWTLHGITRRGSGMPLSFLDNVYFSGITFATIGYGDFIPAPPVRLVALSEGLIGIFMMGFFVAVLANRLNKS